MRKLVLLLTIFLFAIPVSLAVFFSLAIEAQPRVVRQVTLAPEHIERAKKIIDTHHYQVRSGMLATVRILSKDADIAANYLVNRFAKGNAHVNLSDRGAFVRLSLPMPENIVNGYLNFEANLIQTEGFPQLQSLRIGNLALPDFVTNILVSQCITWLQRIPEFRSGMAAIQRVRLSPNEINISYRWENDFYQKMNGISLIDEQEKARLLQYQSLLVENSQTHDARIPLSDVLPPLMHLAAKRSINGAAIAENRAMILVTTFYALGMPLRHLIPDASNWPQPVRRVVTIDGRDDLAKHFMVSAAITAYADTILSDAIGLYKEIEDSRTGSGFSFNDIAADRAGTRFGEKAVANQVSAQRLQQQLVTSRLRDTDLMPAWSDLPEFMHEAEFKKRFGGIDAPAYHKMMEKIEQRIAKLHILR